MGRAQYLVDTNAVIDYLGNKLPVDGLEFMNNIMDDVPCVSVITKIEVLGFNAPLEHFTFLNEFMNDVTVLNLTNEVVEKCIAIRKNHKTKLPDAIIAATALVFSLVLVTRNISDFKNIDGLQLLDLHSL